MSGSFEERAPAQRPGAGATTKDLGVPGKSTLTAGTLPRTTNDAPSAATGGHPTPPRSAETGPVRITADALNVRRAPEVVPGNILGGLHRGAVVVSLARVGDWLRIEYRGEVGFVHGAFVEQIERPMAADGAAAPVPNTDHVPATLPQPPPSANTEPARPHEPGSATLPPSTGGGHPATSATSSAPGPAGPASGGPAAAAGGPSATSASAEPGTWAPPAGAKLDDPKLLELAAKVHDPKLDQLLHDLAGVIELERALRKTKSLETRFEIKGKDRATLVAGIGVVRRELDGLSNANDTHVNAFKVAVNHKLEEVAPYHFQLNIPTIESPGGWSTCNLTSLAMALEATGKGATAYPTSEHKKLLAVASAFRSDIAQARLAANGTGTDISSLLGLRLPDFLELAAVVEFLASDEPSHDEIVAAAKKAVDMKTRAKFLKQLAHRFGAEAKDKTIQWDASKTGKQNIATTDALRDYGGQHRGDGSHGVEQLSTARNLVEKETDPKKKAAARKRYEALLGGQQAALDGKGIDGDLTLDTYKAAVARELGPEIDAGRGVIAGLFGHWTRLYGIDVDHILVQDPGAWNRTEINVTWAEARAMGYFWANIVIS